MELRDKLSDWARDNGVLLHELVAAVGEIVALCKDNEELNVEEERTEKALDKWVGATDEFVEVLKQAAFE